MSTSRAGVAVVIVALCTGCCCSAATTCASQSLQNATAYVPGSGLGKQLGNFTFDLHPEQVGAIGNQTCCAAASGFGNARSKNLTAGIPWTATVLGPSTARKGWVSILCEAFDYGAAQSGKPSATSGLTPPLVPFPPAPPACGTYSERADCPDGRCFWSDGAPYYMTRGMWHAIKVTNPINYQSINYSYFT